MILFLKLMVISACLLLAILIFVAGHRTYKKGKADKVVWFIFDTYTIYSPTKSKLDPPNLYPTVKAIIDGMTDAGIWTDDNHKVIKKLSFVYGGLSEEKGHYRLEFDIEEVENE